MTKPEWRIRTAMTNDESRFRAIVRTFDIAFSSSIRHSSFVIRH